MDIPKEHWKTITGALSRTKAEALSVTVDANLELIAETVVKIKNGLNEAMNSFVENLYADILKFKTDYITTTSRDTKTKAFATMISLLKVIDDFCRIFDIENPAEKEFSLTNE